MGTSCAPLLADLFLYSYENEFLDNMIRSGHRRLARSFNLCYRYIDDLIVFINKKFLEYLKEIYPSQLTVEKVKCMIKIFRGGRGGDTFKPPRPYKQLLPLPTPCLRCFWEDLLMTPTPHFKHCSLLPPSPPENFDHTLTNQISWQTTLISHSS